MYLLITDSAMLKSKIQVFSLLSDLLYSNPFRLTEIVFPSREFFINQRTHATSRATLLLKSSTEVYLLHGRKAMTS